MNWRGLQVERAAYYRFNELWPVIIVRYAVLIFGLVSLIVVLSHLVVEMPPILLAVSLLGLSFALAVGSWQIYLYQLKYNQNVLLNASNSQQPLDALEIDVIQILRHLRREPTLVKLLEAMIAEPSLRHIFYRLSITEATLRQIRTSPGKAEVEAIITGLAQSARQQNRLANVFDLTLGVLTHSALAEVVESTGLAPDEVELFVDFYRQRYSLELTDKQTLPDRRDRTGGIGHDWATSYTQVLDKLTERIGPELERRNSYFPLYSRSDTVREAVTALAAKQKSLILIGEPGVGKSEVFLHLAGKIATYQTGTILDGHQVRVLDVQNLLYAAKTSGDLQALMIKLLNELSRAGNIVLFIDHIELILGSSSNLGAADTTNIIQSFFSYPSVRLVGATSTQMYQKLIKSNPILSENFVPLEVKPPPTEDLYKIVLGRIIPLENRTGHFFLAQSIKELVRLSERYLKQETAPQREISLSEEVAAETPASQVLILPEDVRRVVGRKAKVPIASNTDQAGKVIRLEALLKQRIIGQGFALKQLGQSLLRSQAGLSSAGRPIGTFLFLGPTGVGKTETAKALADIYFGPRGLIRLDMSEYADDSALAKLLGEDSLQKPGSLTVAIGDTPSAVVLLDEVEKSHPSVKNVLLGLLDEGRLTTNYGKLLDFTNTIIIATSNAGSDIIKTKIEQGVDLSTIQKQLLDYLVSKKIFLPELLNRFDAVAVFSPLSQDQVKSLVKLRLEGLKERLKREKNLRLEVAETVIETISRIGYDPVYGARALDRVIKDTLETAIAKKIVAEPHSPGSKIVVDSI